MLSDLEITSLIGAMDEIMECWSEAPHTPPPGAPKVKRHCLLVDLIQCLIAIGISQRIVLIGVQQRGQDIGPIQFNFK